MVRPHDAIQKDAGIRGVGIDLCHIEEMRRRLNDAASAFAVTHFRPQELDLIQQRPSGDPAQHAAARYAAKEACIKALSQAAEGKRLLPQIDYRELEIVGAHEATPRLVLHGAMQEVARELGVRQILVSLTHEDTLAAAVVVVL